MITSSILFVVALTFASVAVLATQIGHCPGPNDVFINIGGGPNKQGARCDVPAWLKSKGSKFNSFAGVSKPATGVCGILYKSARWAPQGRLEYEIPVPPGTYQVYLMFTEVYFRAKVGLRPLKISVNGKVLETSFDLLAVTKIKTPYLYNAKQVTATNNINVLIEGAKPGVHSQLSGIGIMSVAGSKPNGIIGASGVSACTLAPQPVSATQPSTEPILAPSKAPITVPSPAPIPVPAPLPGTNTAVGACPTADDVFINAGGKNIEGFRCDDPFIKSKSNKFMPKAPKPAGTGCLEAYTSHRWISIGNDMFYDIPVPAGTFTVELLFMENYDKAKAGFRTFSLKVGNTPVQVPGTTGTTFDVFTLSGGINKPYVVPVTNVSPIAGIIKVTVTRIKQNPFISGITIKGNAGVKASGVVTTLGSTSCSAVKPVENPIDVPGPAPAPASPSSIPAPEPGAVSDGLGICPAAGDVFINAGGENIEGFRCDDPFTSTVSKKYMPSAAKPAGTGCMEVFTSHRWLKSGSDIVYDIKVPAGTFTVYLLFMENYQPATAGFRTFSVKVGNTPVQVPGTTGTTFDIFTLAGGVNKPYVVPVTSVSPIAGSIKVTITRMKQNPFISGIAIKGNAGVKADGVVTTLGSTSCAKSVSPVVEPNPIVAPPPNGEPNPVVAPPLTAEPDATPIPEGVGVCPGNTDVFVNAGGENIEGFRCDDPFVASKSNKFMPPIPKPAGSGCIEAFKSHRWLSIGNDLVYNFKVPAGTYTVYLLFMENYKGASAGFRTFSVKVGNTPVQVPGTASTTFDIFTLAGLNMPYTVTVPDVSPSGGNIKVTVTRIKQNPFISGIGIKGNAGVEANTEIGSLGVTSCSAKPTGPKCNPNKKADSDFSGVHSAHAVTGGPYVVTNFDKTGRQTVELDALRSHSHGTDNDGKQIVITNWIWSWNDPAHPKANAQGKVTVEGFAPKEKFPIGKTTLELRAVDSACDVGLDVTDVIVNPSSKKGAYCYFYDYGTSTSATVPIPEDITTGQRPVFGIEAGDIDYKGANPFNFLPFSGNSIAVRCVYIIDLPNAANIAYKVAHNGPVKVFKDGTEVLSGTGSTTKTIPSKLYAKGMHKWQILYFSAKGTAGKLQLLGANNVALTNSQIGHDAGATIPVVKSLSKTTSAPGIDITISGTAFVNDVMVLFGANEAETLDVSAGSLIVRVPPQGTSPKVVDVTVKTNAGISNAIKFTYPGLTSTGKSCVSPSWKVLTLKEGGKNYVSDGVAAIKYGPDGRLYLGTLNQKVIVLKHDKNLSVQSKFEKEFPTGCKCKRAVLGLNFDPREKAPFNMYFSSSVIFWSKNDRIPTVEAGWKNGKIHKVPVTPNGPFGAITDLITGLPVSNHDHAVNWIEFLPGNGNNGKMLVSVGGFTNGGISEPGDLLGGVPGSQLSGAIIECPKSVTNLVYSNPANPAAAKIISQKKCNVYAAGFRNSFGGMLHSNGAVYATDNGPNFQFGSFSTNCKGGKKGGATTLDYLHKLEKGSCHGFPNIPRANAIGEPRQCTYNHPDCTAPVLNNLARSSNGVLDYRSNVFNGEFKNNIFVTRFSNQGFSKGSIQRVQLDAAGGAQNVNLKFWGDSGVAVAEGPRGEIVMARVYKSSFYILQPNCKKVTNTYLIGVHPKRGSSTGGQTVLISGFGFGTTPTASFGNKPCTNVKSIDNTQFTCVTPAGAANQQVKVTVVGTTGLNEETKGTDFWYF